MSSSYYAYIMASRRNGALYIGVTNDLLRRVSEHKQGLIEGFTQRYQVHSLVYYTEISDINAAIAHEKRLKGWKRSKKVALIEDQNPTWQDLWEKIV